MCKYHFFIGSGLLSQIEIDDRFDGKGVHPYSGGAGLEPRTFRIGLVDSFGSSFVEGWKT